MLNMKTKLKTIIKNSCCRTNVYVRIRIIYDFFTETLRMYPPASILMRKAISDYTFNDTKITIPKEMKIWIPVFAIHRDSVINPNPNSFDPERFDKDAMASRHPMHYLPFGDGPRNCIGIN